MKHWIMPDEHDPTKSEVTHLMSEADTNKVSSSCVRLLVFIGIVCGYIWVCELRYRVFA